jgi:hypothetical protein
VPGRRAGSAGENRPGQRHGDESRKEDTMSRRTTHLAASAIVLACALAATLLTAGPASAASRGYKIHNLSSHPLKLEQVNQLPNPDARRDPLSRKFFDIGFEGRPTDGDVLKPGAPPHGLGAHIRVRHDLRGEPGLQHRRDES